MTPHLYACLLLGALMLGMVGGLLLAAGAESAVHRTVAWWRGRGNNLGERA